MITNNILKIYVQIQVMVFILIINIWGKNIGNYIKFQSCEPNRKKLQLFYTFSDGVLCSNICIGELISFNNVRHQRYKDGKL